MGTRKIVPLRPRQKEGRQVTPKPLTLADIAITSGRRTTEMKRESRRWLLKRLVGTAVVVLAYWIDDVLELLSPARPELRHYTLTAETGSFTLRGGNVHFRLTELLV